MAVCCRVLQCFDPCIPNGLAISSRGGKPYCNTLQHTATHGKTLQHIAKLLHSQNRASSSRDKESHRQLAVCNKYCDTLLHTATHCSTLQHTATHCQLEQKQGESAPISCICCIHTFDPEAAVCGSVLQCVAVRCSVSQYLLHSYILSRCCSM